MQEAQEETGCVYRLYEVPTRLRHTPGQLRNMTLQPCRGVPSQEASTAAKTHQELPEEPVGCKHSGLLGIWPQCTPQSTYLLALLALSCPSAHDQAHSCPGKPTAPSSTSSVLFYSCLPDLRPHSPPGSAVLQLSHGSFWLLWDLFFLVILQS